VVLLCAAGIGAAGWNGVRLHGGDGTLGTAAALAGAVTSARNTPPLAIPSKRSRRVPVLFQSEPEGADIYVAGRLESVGTTPRWVTLEMDPTVPTRVMVRKAGFQDKAIAVESDRPPTVELIAIGVPAAAPALAGPASGDPGKERQRAAAARRSKGTPAPSSLGVKLSSETVSASGTNSDDEVKEADPTLP